MTEMFGEAWSPMSVPDLAPDDDDDDITGDSEPQKQGQCLAMISKWQNRQSQQVNLDERTLFVFSSKL